MREDFKIEVEEDAVVLVLPRKLDTYITVWQDAQRLGEVLEQAANDVPNRSSLLDPVLMQRESEQVKLNTHQKHVCMIFDWTDRIRLCPGAAVLVARAIRAMAQDCEMAERKVHISYKAKGRKGRPTPVWDGGRLPKQFGGLRP
jgi:hypothetical protein